MRKNYKDFAADFAASGLSRKDYGKRQGMSSNMVSYYLKRARIEQEQAGSFKQIEIIPPISESRAIKIVTPKGLQICFEFRQMTNNTVWCRLFDSIHVPR